VWHYTDGPDALIAASAEEAAAADLRTYLHDRYDMYDEDLKAASILTLHRSGDLARGWWHLADESPPASLSRVALARALFEIGLEARRLSLYLVQNLSLDARRPGAGVEFADGLTVPLFRFLGGEKTGRVGPRETTRNSLSNVQILRKEAATARYADAYDVASRLLHDGKLAQIEDLRSLSHAEATLLLGGANMSLMAAAAFAQCHDLVDAFRQDLNEQRDIVTCVALATDDALPTPDWLPDWMADGR
jgi:hypothetical protein